MAAAAGISTPDRIKTLLSSFVDPAEHPNNQDTSIPDKSSASGTALLCQDKQAFLERVQTYRLTWLAKPTSLSPLQCARYGWKNVDKDLLQCVTCRTFISGQLPLFGDNVQVYEACRDRLTQQLTAGHHFCCSWANNPSPEHFLRVPEIKHEEAVSSFRQRAQDMFSLESQLPCLNEELLEDMGLDPRIIKAITAVATNREADVSVSVAQSAAVLALCGWKRKSQSSMATIHCEYCQRDVGLWNFHSLAGFEEPNDNEDEESEDEQEEEKQEEEQEEGVEEGQGLAEADGEKEKEETEADKNNSERVKTDQEEEAEVSDGGGEKSEEKDAEDQEKEVQVSDGGEEKNEEEKGAEDQEEESEVSDSGGEKNEEEKKAEEVTSEKGEKIEEEETVEVSGKGDAEDQMKEDEELQISEDEEEMEVEKPEEDKTEGSSPVGDSRETGEKGQLEERRQHTDMEEGTAKKEDLEGDDTKHDMEIVEEVNTEEVGEKDESKDKSCVKDIPGNDDEKSSQPEVEQKPCESTEATETVVEGESSDKEPRDTSVEEKSTDSCEVSKADEVVEGKSGVVDDKSGDEPDEEKRPDVGDKTSESADPSDSDRGLPPVSQGSADSENLPQQSAGVGKSRSASDQPQSDKPFKGTSLNTPKKLQTWRRMDYRSKSPSDNDSDSNEEDDEDDHGRLPRMSQRTEDSEQEHNTSPVKNIRPRFPLPSGAGSEGYIIKSPAKRPLPFGESSENEEESDEDSVEERRVSRRVWQERREYSESESEEEASGGMRVDERSSSRGQRGRKAARVSPGSGNLERLGAGDASISQYRTPEESDSDSDVLVYTVDGACDLLTYSVDGPPDGRPGEDSGSDDEVLIVDSDDEEETAQGQERPESPESPDEDEEGDDYYSEDSGSDGERSYDGEESGGSPDVVVAVESESESEEGPPGPATADGSHRGEHTLEESNSSSALHWTEVGALEDDNSSLARQELWEAGMAGEEQSFMMERQDLHSLAMQAGPTQTAEDQQPGFSTSQSAGYGTAGSFNNAGYSESYNTTSHTMGTNPFVSSENTDQPDMAVASGSSIELTQQTTTAVDPSPAWPVELSQEQSEDEEADNSNSSVCLNDSNYSSDGDAEQASSEEHNDSLTNFTQHQLSSIAEENSEELEDEPSVESHNVPEKTDSSLPSDLETNDIDLDALQADSCPEMDYSTTPASHDQLNASHTEVSMDTTGLNLSEYAGLLDSSTESTQRGNKRTSEDVEEEERRAAKRANLRKQHFFHPVEEHKAFCPWVVASSSRLSESQSEASIESHDQGVVKGWQRLLAILQQHKTPRKSSKTTPPHENLRRLRKIFNDWSSPHQPMLNVT